MTSRTLLTNARAEPACELNRLIPIEIVTGVGPLGLTVPRQIDHQHHP